MNNQNSDKTSKATQSKIDRLNNFLSSAKKSSNLTADTSAQTPTVLNDIPEKPLKCEYDVITLPPIKKSASQPNSLKINLNYSRITNRSSPYNLSKSQRKQSLARKVDENETGGSFRQSLHLKSAFDQKFDEEDTIREFSEKEGLVNYDSCDDELSKKFLDQNLDVHNLPLPMGEYEIKQPVGYFKQNTVMICKGRCSECSQIHQFDSS